MLEHMGLGVVLTMKDDFTPQANTAVKSMTRLENQANEMSKNVQKSMNNLQNIMLAGFSLNTVGNSFQKAGVGILKTLGGVASQVVSVNSKFDTMKAQLKTVYGSAKEAQKQLEWATNFAIKTPFNAEGTVRALQMMKSQGVDVTKTFINAKGEAKSFLEYMGDFATRNMSSTGGFTGMAYAMSNAIGGDFVSIRKRFDLAKSEADKLKSVYESKGMSGFMDAFTKLADKVTPDAMRNLIGTWDETVAEMQDTWSVFVWRLGDAGAYNPIKKTLLNISMSLAKMMNTDTINALAKTIADLWKPIDRMVNWLIKATQWLVKFAGEHPKITKMVAGFLAISGVGMILTGTIMKLTGGFLILTASLASTYLNFKLMKQLNMGGEFDFMWKSASRASRGFGILGLTTAGIALALQSNFLGVRDKTKSTLEYISNAWTNSNKLINNGTKEIKIHEAEYDNLRNKFVKLRLLGMILQATFFRKQDGDNIVYSKKELENLRIFGLLPVAQTFAIMKGRAKSFFGGIKDGLGSAIFMAKEFLNMYLKPIMTVFQSVGSSIGDLFIPFKSKLGIKGDGGMDKGVADKQMEKFKEVGQKAGILLGALLGFKIIKTLSPILTSPFKLMTKAIGGSLKAVGKLHGAVSNVFSKKDHSSSSSAGVGTGSTWKSRKAKAKNRFEEFLNEYQDLPENEKTSDVDGYKKVRHLPNRFNKFVLPQTNGSGVDSNNIYAKHKSKLFERLFGNSYYTKDAKGDMKSLGRWGGRFNADRDDQQMILSLQKFKAGGGILKKPTLDDFGGDKVAYANTVNNHLPKLDGFAGRASNIIKGQLSDDKFEAKKLSTYKSTDLWKNRYKLAGIDGRKMTRQARAEFTDSTLKNIASSNLPEVEALRAEEKFRGTDLYARNNQGFLSKALFGKKIYSIDEDENGKLSRHTVARSGGLFHNREDDMVHHERASLKDRFKSSRLGKGLSFAKAGIGSGLHKFKGSLGDTKLAHGLRQAKHGLGSSYNAIKEQVMGTGFGDFLKQVNPKRYNVGKVGKQHFNFKDKMSNGFHALFGSELKDEGGGVVRKAGLFPKVGAKISGVGHGVGKFAKGTGKVFGKVGRGAGKLLGGAGKLAMGALPLVGGALSLGKMGFNMISAKGGGDFSKGLKLLKKDVCKIDLSSLWKKFSKTAKNSFGTIKEIGKIAFKKLAEVLPTVMSDAFKGLQGIAGTAWQFIKDNGAKMFGNLIDWIMGKGLPMLFKGLMGIGKWMVTDLLPFVWKMLQVAVPKVLKGLVGLVKTGLSSLGNIVGTVLLKTLGSALSSIPFIGKKVVKALGLPTFAVGTRYLPYDMPIMAHKGEMIVPESENPYANTHKGSTLPKQGSNVDNSVHIDKVEIVVKADKLSREEARKQAKMILSELKAMNKEKLIRQYV